MKDKKTNEDDYWLTRLFLLRGFLFLTFIISSFLIAKYADNDIGSWLPATIICAISFTAIIVTFQSLYKD